MLRDIDANNRRDTSKNIEDKYTTEELDTILYDAKEKLPPLVVRYAKEMEVNYKKVFVKAQKNSMGFML